MSEHPRTLLRFGGFELDPATGELSHRGETLRLQPQPHKLLLALLENPGELVTREQLKLKIVPDTLFGDADHAINLAITKLRSALQDSAEHPQYIDTLPRRGYRFIAPVETVPGETEETVVSDAKRRVTGRGARTLAIATVVALIASAVLIWVRVHRSTKLSEKDTIVLAAFANTTGDPVFDGTLRQGLSAQLQQSPFLNMMSDERIAEVMARMAQPKGTALTNDLAREVCQRTGSSATIQGRIATMGSQYVLQLRSVNCSSQDLLADVQVTAAGKEQVLQALGAGATELRRRLGEVKTSIANHAAPAEDVTTSSLEALQAYSRGVDAINIRVDEKVAASLFQHATELDPNFAMAWARLGAAYGNVGETERAAECYRKAYALRDRVSGRERLYIESHYQQSVVRDLEAARNIYVSWLEVYPNDLIPMTNIPVIDFRLGHYGNPVPIVEEIVRRDPQSGFSRVELVWYLALSGRLQEAKARAREAIADGADSPDLHLRLYHIAFLENDIAGMEREVSYLREVPEYRDVILSLEASTAAWHGQFNSARVLTRRAADTALLSGKVESAAAYYAAEAVGEAFAGNYEEARKGAQAALLLANSDYVEGQAAIAFAIAGAPDRAQRLADDLAQRFPEATIIRSNILPSIRSAKAVRSGSADKAIEALAPAETYDFATSFEMVNYYPVYLRGLAYLGTNNGNAAVTEFQKIHDHRFVVANTPIGALAHLGTGRAYAMAGESARAKVAYERFFELWSNADTDVPILQRAKAEYAKLK